MVQQDFASAQRHDVIRHLLEPLNDAQRAAVTAPECNAMVVAGAGSGKTRVLIHRFAYLVHQFDIAPHEILAVTFTNKAANEMRTRAQNLLGIHFANLWLGTFHSTALRVLRIHYELVGLPQAFEIIDTSAQVQVIKRLMKQHEFSSDDVEAKEYASFISRQKERGQRARHASASNANFRNATLFTEMYKLYEDYCNREGLVDFSEMLLRTLELWQDHEEILNSYQRRFRHILVDEYQDTNEIQAAWLRMLKSSENYVLVVGDDDQAIYGWRGAKVDNLLNFRRDFEDVQRYTLEQNYRSTNPILSAANGLIEQNNERLGKKLWTDRDEGELVHNFLAQDAVAECHYILARVQRWLDRNPSYTFNAVAILYRNNALSRLVEQILTAEDIPYRITGGLQFYARAEIRDALAYMKLMQDPHSNVSFERVINEPKRGIGLKSVENLRDIAAARGMSLWDAAKFFVEDSTGSSRGRAAIRSFLALVETMQQKCKGSSLAGIAKVCVEDSGLLAKYQAQDNETGRSKAENLEELVTACSQFNPEDVIRTSTTSPDSDLPSENLRRFLDKTALEAGDANEVRADGINLMTMHSSKGLEFPLVFIIGMEEQILPNNEASIEEERRLVFVGMTRAMHELHLCSANSRMVFGRTEYRMPSRFLNEIPEEFVKKSYQTGLQSRTTTNRFERKPPSPVALRSRNAERNSRFALGQDVIHEMFGVGTIINDRSHGHQVQIRFEDGTTRWFVADAPKLRAKNT